MRTLSAVTFVVLLSSALVFGQTPPSSAPSLPPAKYDAEIALAKLALQAHGGEKLKNMKSLVVRGTLDLTTSAFNQAIPATFSMVLAKDKYRLEIANPFQPFKQVSDGVNTVSSIQSGWTLPPITRVGFPVLSMVGEPGFVISPLPSDKKKMKGFRMTSPDGYSTDFYLDEKTNQVKGYDGTYDIHGRVVTTSAVIDKLRVVDGISIPERYAQRFNLEQVTAYCDFKVKEILVNSELADDVFSTGR